jgi:toluene monooxygenase system ferredoxin subunit
MLLSQGEWDEEEDLLLCSGHRWEFDLRTGRGINPPCTLYRYLVEIGEDVVRIGVPNDGQSHYHRREEPE